MSETLRQLVPTLVSILIILVVTVVRSYSTTAAVIVATMPINIPLTLWIIYHGAGGDRPTMVGFTQSLFPALAATLFFAAAAWLAARAGWRLAPMIAVGYAAWGIALALLLGVPRWLAR